MDALAGSDLVLFASDEPFEMSISEPEFMTNPCLSVSELGRGVLRKSPSPGMPLFFLRFFSLLLSMLSRNKVSLLFIMFAGLPIVEIFLGDNLGAIPCVGASVSLTWLSSVVDGSEDKEPSSGRLDIAAPFPCGLGSILG